MPLQPVLFPYVIIHTNVKVHLDTVMLRRKWWFEKNKWRKNAARFCDAIQKVHLKEFSWFLSSCDEFFKLSVGSKWFYAL